MVCFTNHALDQFLGDLLDIGIPSDQMVRLGGKSDARTKCMALYDQSSTFKHSQASRKIIDDLESKTDALANRLHQVFARYQSKNIRPVDLMEDLEFLPECSHFYETFSLPEVEDGSVRVGQGGKAINDTYLLDQWAKGKNAGMFLNQVREISQPVWRMTMPERADLLSAWKLEILR